MTAARLRTVFLVDAVYSLLTGLVFLAGTWDGLYDALDLAQPKPGISSQIAGAMLVAFAYLLWVAPRVREMWLPLARASAVGNALSVVILVAWLVDGGLRLDSRGEIQLGVLAAFMAVLAVLYTLASVKHVDGAARPG